MASAWIAIGVAERVAAAVSAPTSPSSASGAG